MLLFNKENILLGFIKLVLALIGKISYKFQLWIVWWWYCDFWPGNKKLYSQIGPHVKLGIIMETVVS